MLRTFVGQCRPHRAPRPLDGALPRSGGQAGPQHRAPWSGALQDPPPSLDKRAERELLGRERGSLQRMRTTVLRTLCWLRGCGRTRRRGFRFGARAMHADWSGRVVPEPRTRPASSGWARGARARKPAPCERRSLGGLNFAARVALGHYNLPRPLTPERVDFWFGPPVSFPVLS